uniref:Photosystem II reaction center M protein n=1 Tax=Helicotheca tamesis TaxID=374047 RepID=A0A7S2IGU6_9STRA|mmetsp:Transcript_9206/g.12795  ORF Transcript_9206/g.12795 Transcript_9206/m.12795 type:complete len:114 (+) Transcript_9206:87-428(+)|eukprot:CAMPEP_0185727668 /NCGR_PEP_ID=MMETSP1171-20130828/3285_1 /TAXON_ID=374046 /ORGANISM="Helicotheca tamensis, Strain CCMP826" /LENGTH=113 /DNA_ID=CAMNT_0028396281 /DNA_START=69 /DNA_END=410 /DNA_ORIENTATION=-
MKTFQLVALFALIASAMAFVPNQAPKVVETVSAGFDLKKAAVAAIPAATIATPAFALDSIVEALPTNTVALEVQFGAYLAVLLGTFLPVLFLVNLYIQTEARAAGRAGGQDAE